MATAAPNQNLPIFYRGIEPLNVSIHGKMNVRPVLNMEEVARTHAVPLTTDEFALVQRSHDGPEGGVGHLRRAALEAKRAADGPSCDRDRRNVGAEQRFVVGAEIVPTARHLDGDHIAVETIGSDVGEPRIATQQLAVPDVTDAASDRLVDPEFAFEEAVETA